MAMSRFNFADTLNHSVENSETFADLIPLLQFIFNDLDSVKLFIKDKLNNFTPQQTRTAFYSTLSIEDLLPTDIIQSIISFDNSRKFKEISKTFNNCYEQNLRLQIKQNQKEILSRFSDGSKWIVHKTQKMLSSTDKALGFKGPINDINKAIEIAATNDKIFIEDGEYDLQSTDIHKSLQIIGRGQNVKIKGYAQYDDKAIIIIHSNINIQSITFERTVFSIGDLTEYKSNPGYVYFEGCQMNKVGGCYTLDVYRGSLNVCNSLFQDGKNAIYLASTANNVYVSQCTFTKCNRAYNNMYPCVSVGRGKHSVKKMFKCIDCEFSG